MMIIMISVIIVICITYLTAPHSHISGNLSLPRDKINTSAELELTQTLAGPGVSSNTPDMSRISAR